MKRFIIIAGLCLLTGSLWAGSLTITAPSTAVGGSSPQWQYNNSGSIAGVTPTSFNTSLTLSSSHTVVLASATAAGVTLTLPAASSTGQILQITKVDASTFPITIVAKAGDLVGGTTGTLTLNAISQSDEIIADGSTTWWPYGSGIQATPPWIGTYEGTNVAAEATSSDVVVCPFYAPVPISIVGYRYYASNGNANVTLGIYDNAGNLIVSTGPVNQGTGTKQIATNNINLPPGQYYYAYQASNTGYLVGTPAAANNNNGSIICSKRAATSGVLPTTYTFGSAATNDFAIFLTLAGGRTTN